MIEARRPASPKWRDLVTIAKAELQTLAPRSALRWTERSDRPVLAAVSAVKRTTSARSRVSPTWRLTSGEPCAAPGWSCSNAVLRFAVNNARPAADS